MEEGEIASEELTTGLFQKLIVDSDPEVTVDLIEVSTGSGRGDNYTSQLYRVRAEGHAYCNGFKWTKSFICKILPANRVRREAFKSEALFKNEVAFYTHALPALLTFQKSHGCEIFKETPKVYLAKPTIIILEDLKEKGYVMIDRKKALDVKHCQAILRTLGHLHGVSLALKTSNPTIFGEEVTGRINECLFRPENEEWYTDYYQAAGENALKMLRDSVDGTASSDKYLERFSKFVYDGFFKRMVEKVAAIEPVAVLCHGDCWTNNFLFCYDQAGEITSLRMVDFQFARYGSPALDLVYLLFNCTNQDVRREQLSLLIDTYCSSLTETLTLLGCPTDVLGPGDIVAVINDEVSRCGSVGLGLAIEMIPICTCDSEEAPDLYCPELNQTEDKEKQVDVVPHSNEACRVRITELIVELVENDII